jgi:outer membrane protein TolC
MKRSVIIKVERDKLLKKIFITGLIFFIISLCVCAEEAISLEDVLKLGLKNNKAIKEGEIELKKAEIDLDSSRRAFYPEISFSTSYTRLFLDDDGGTGIDIEPPDPARLDDQDMYLLDYINKNMVSPIYGAFRAMQPYEDNYQTSISIQQPIYLGGKLRLANKQAGKAFELSEVQFNEKINEVLFSIIQSYYGVLLAEERVKIEEEAFNLLREHKRIAEVSLEAGLSIKTDLLQVEIEESRAMYSLQTARNDLKMARKMLGNMIGHDLSKYSFLEPDFDYDPELDLELQYQRARERRGEFKLLNINKEMLELSLETESNPYLPVLVLIGNYQWQDNELSFDNGTGSITFSLSMNIFDKGLAKNTADKLRNDLEKLKLQRSNLEEMIRLEIEDILLTIEENKNNMELQAMNLERAQENLELEEKRYQAGTATNMDVMNAQLVLKQTKISKIQSEYQYQISVFQLLKNTGLLAEYFQEVVYYVES